MGAGFRVEKELIKTPSKEVERIVESNKTKHISNSGKEIKTPRSIMHKYWAIDDERQDWLNYAYKLGGMDFVLTILAENGTMGIIRQSEVYKNGIRETSYGLCQIHSGHHPEILSHGKNGKKFMDWFYDPYKQLEFCYLKYAGGTIFYGYYVRHKMKDKIIFD